MQPKRLAQRKSTRKSRHGCQECKQRHVKCDETRPSCANCTVRNSPCSFLSTTGRRPPTLSSVSSSLSSSSSPMSAAASASASASATGSPRPDEATSLCTALSTRHHPAGHVLTVPTPLSQYEPPFPINSLVSTNQTFKLYHLELLHNFKVGVLEESVLQLSAAEGYMAMTIREAAQAPYLMDQVLAVSAANMSVKRPHQRRFYQEEATRLQTRGLALFNACRALEVADHAMPRFIFSTLLSYQVLFDAFSVRASFPMFLDRLVAAFRICGGVRIICGKSWPIIITQYQENVGINLPGEFVATSGPESRLTRELARLETLLENSNLGPSMLNPCNEALKFLRDLSYADDRPTFLKYLTSRLIQWAVVVPTEFVNLVEERRPEALIIIAYYGVLIHDTRGYWVSGDAGAFIIRSITSFLGNHWAGWLQWPNEVLDSVDSNTEIRSLSPIEIDMQCNVDQQP
ncbi:hypothetical protein F5Y09DRAFT_180455 [Xylaria sp. FL1042]|nr:hypothetical protein F5Y09DRAFT_180455 [Xylaria sp. FL1042]